MENKKDKTNTVLVTAIGAAVLLIAVVGATFAYFSATITGNVSNSNVHVSTGRIGTSYMDITDSQLELLNVNLPYDERQGTEGAENPTDTAIFSLRTNSTVVQGLTLSVEDFTNNFCQYYDESTKLCFDDNTKTGVCLVAGIYNSTIIDQTACEATEDGQWRTLNLIDKSDEASFVLEQCPAGSIGVDPNNNNSICTDADNNGEEDWTLVVKDPIPNYEAGGQISGSFPVGVTSFLILDKQNVPAQALDSEDYTILLYKLTATILNKAETQNYNQGKRIAGIVTASISTGLSDAE